MQERAAASAAAAARAPRHRAMAFASKWWALTASLPVALSSGLTYTFSVWSDVIRERYGLSQEQLEGIGSAANLGG